MIFNFSAFIRHFQGRNLLVAVDASQYSVKIGQESCSNIEVTMNSITCLPPKSEPDDPLHHNTRVQVRPA